MRFSSSSAAFLAFCVATSNALPTADLVVRTFFFRSHSHERGQTGVLTYIFHQPRRTFMPPEGLPPIDESIPGCKGATFPPTIPPTIAEMRCRGINEVDRRAIALPPIDETIPGCKGVSFLDVYPPSAAEMRCRGLPEGVMRRSAEDKRAPWTFGELLPPIDQTIPGCKDVAFPDIYPPSTAELMCRGVVGQDGMAKMSN